MLNFFREGLHYIYMTFFQTLTLREETANLSKKEAIIIFLRTYVVACVLAMGLLAIGGGVSEAVGYSFDWYLTSKKLFSGLIGGLVVSNSRRS